MIRRFVILVATVHLSLAGCVLPPVLQAVREPRDGRPLHQRLCIVYAQRYEVNLGGFECLHAFDTHKYARIYRALVHDGVIEPADIWVPGEISRADLLRVHSPAYLQSLRQANKLAAYLELRAVVLLPAGLRDAAVVRPQRYATGGTLLAARLALQHGMAINLGGGYHHAEPECGGGFCLYADMPIAIRTLQAEGLIRRALVVDLDVHQGNGTARCLESDDQVFTFDMHEGDIYPMPKENNDLDVPLRAGVGDEEYLAILSRNLSAVFDQAAPDLVFLQAGADVLEGDPLAHLRLTPDGVAQRDARVFAEADRRHIPIVMVLGGGYSRQAWCVQYRSVRQLIERYGAAPAATGR